MAHDVFISYATKDAEVAQAACHVMEEAGIRCWMAPRDVTPGRPYAGEIVAAIEGCAVMVVIYSQHSNASGMVMRELERAASLSRALLPVRVEDVPPSQEMQFFVGREHWLDALTEPREEHLRKLAEAVRKLIGEAGARRSGPGGPADASAEPQRPVVERMGEPVPRAAAARRSPWRAIAAAALVLGAVATAAYFAKRGHGPATSSAGVAPVESTLEAVPSGAPELVSRETGPGPAATAVESIPAATAETPGVDSSQAERTRMAEAARRAREEYHRINDATDLPAGWGSQLGPIATLASEAEDALSRHDYRRARTGFESASQLLQELAARAAKETASQKAEADAEREKWEYAADEGRQILEMRTDLFGPALSAGEAGRAAYNAGDFAAAQGRYRSARMELVRACVTMSNELDPGLPEALLRATLACVLVSYAGDPEESEQVLARVEELCLNGPAQAMDPTVQLLRAGALFERARLRRGGEQGYLAGAASLASAITAGDPSFDVAWGLRSLIALEQSRYASGAEAVRLISDAEEMLRRSESLSDDDGDPHAAAERAWDWACIAGMKGDTAACLRHLRTAGETSGYLKQWKLRREPDFDRVRDAPEFQQFAAALPEW